MPQAKGRGRNLACTCTAALLSCRARAPNHHVTVNQIVYLWVNNCVNLRWPREQDYPNIPTLNKGFFDNHIMSLNEIAKLMPRHVRLLCLAIFRTTRYCRLRDFAYRRGAHFCSSSSKTLMDDDNKLDKNRNRRN